MKRMLLAVCLLVLALVIMYIKELVPTAKEVALAIDPCITQNNDLMQAATLKNIWSLVPDSSTHWQLGEIQANLEKIRTFAACQKDNPCYQQHLQHWIEYYENKIREGKNSREVLEAEISAFNTRRRAVNILADKLPKLDGCQTLKK